MHIGNVKVEHSMCDLGASINIPSLYVYNRLTNIELVDTTVAIQLVDKSRICLRIFEDVLIKVLGFLYPTYFYINKRVNYKNSLWTMGLSCP